MAECGICLGEIKEPVCIPCGHVHCQECLCAYINSSNDALKSSCPSCRSIFYIAMPDLSVVPKKYQDFMVPSIRKLYVDIPSNGALVAEIEDLKDHVAALRHSLKKEKEAHTAASHQYAIKEKNASLEVQAAMDTTCQVQKKYHALKTKYEAHLNQSLSQTSSDNRKRKSEAFSHVECPPCTSRPKRALPESSVNSTSQQEISLDPPPRFVKRQRHSDAGPSR